MLNTPILTNTSRSTDAQGSVWEVMMIMSDLDLSILLHIRPLLHSPHCTVLTIIWFTLLFLHHIPV